VDHPASCALDLPELGRELAGSTRFTTLAWHETLPSTQDLAATLAPEGADVAVWADRQTAGRGRRGRSWSSAVGGLDVEVTFRSHLSRPPTVRLPAALPAAIAASLEAACTDQDVALPEPIRVKWPNDLLLGGRKLCGLLVDVASNGAGGCRVLIGVGLGVNRSTDDYPDDLRAIATSLAREAGVPRLDRGRILLAVALGVDRALALVARDDETDRHDARTLAGELDRRLLGPGPRPIAAHLTRLGREVPESVLVARADLAGLRLGALDETATPLSWASVERFEVPGVRAASPDP
jgi:biotin-[acetyl-CoA-carboxylase] ligase BirA-like protein